MVADFFRGKRITLMGLGLLGRGIGDARFLASQGAQVLVTDLKTKEQLASSLGELAGLPIMYVLGEHRLEDFRNTDMVIKAAGVPLDSPYIAEARKYNIPVEMSTALFTRLAKEKSGVKIVGITGTRGKSTVTQLIYEILTEAYKGKGRVFLGGNVRGMSTLELLPHIKPKDIVVLELDSWQLQGFGEMRKSPDVAVFTTFFRDHMNYYKDDMETYFLDKSYVYRFQKPGDVLVMGTQVNQWILENDKQSSEVVSPIIANEQTIPEKWVLKIPGTHNRYNVGVAIATTRAMGVPEEVIKKVVESFIGVPGRLEYRGTKRGIGFYNDTTATTPEAVIVALRAMKEIGKNIVLIMGGANKGLHMNELLPLLKEIKSIVCLPGTGTDVLMTNPEFQALKPTLTKNLPEAFQSACSQAKQGDVVLLSPGFASFGLFKNEFDRGDQFNALVESLK